MDLPSSPSIFLHCSLAAGEGRCDGHSLLTAQPLWHSQGPSPLGLSFFASSPCLCTHCRVSSWSPVPYKAQLQLPARVRPAAPCPPWYLVPSVSVAGRKFWPLTYLSPLVDLCAPCAKHPAPLKAESRQRIMESGWR